MILQIIKKKKIIIHAIVSNQIDLLFNQSLMPRTTKDLIFQCNEDLYFFFFLKYTVKNIVLI